jgi:hypothetical protein
MNKHESTSTQSGTGTNVYTIAHGLPIKPFYVSVQALSDDAVYDFHAAAFLPFSVT